MVGVLNRIYQNRLTGELSEKKKNHQFVSTSLVFDEETRIIFYCFLKESSSSKITRNYVMSAYIDENGKNCRFVDNKIVEVSGY